jgi:hypothetical protein
MDDFLYQSSNNLVYLLIMCEIQSTLFMDFYKMNLIISRPPEARMVSSYL